MKEQDLHKRIRQNASIDNTRLANELKELHPELDLSSEKPPQKSITRRVAIFAPLAAAAVVAVVLIPTLLLRGGGYAGSAPESPDSGSAPESPGGSDPQPTEYAEKKLDITVKEYNENNGTSFLYFDYGADAGTVYEYTNRETGELWALTVKYNAEDEIEYRVVADSAPREFTDYFYSACDTDTEITGLSVKWGDSSVGVCALFDYKSYTYCLELKNDGETRLFELIEILISSRALREDNI
ncbi:MAG: hypothetical protein J1F39_01400 [Clostridiales bacterium]|nr:hypothetical protein [Clostridiales bacterium]